MSSGAQGEGHWIVPITLCFGSYDVHKSFLLQSKSETHDVKDFLGSTHKGLNCWIKLNVDQAGFYRVKYDELLAARLRYAVEKQLLSASDRFGKLDIHLKIYFQWFKRKRLIMCDLFTLTDILDYSFALCMVRQ